MEGFDPKARRELRRMEEEFHLHRLKGKLDPTAVRLAEHSRVWSVQTLA